MKANRPAAEETIVERDRAAALLDPLRQRILAHCHEPSSAAQVAAELGMSRQRVNYHVRELARLRLLRWAGRRRNRGFFEQLYVASARRYRLGTDLLGPIG